MSAPLSPAPVREGRLRHAAGWWWTDVELEPTPELRWLRSIAVYYSMRWQDSQVRSVIRAVTLPIRRTAWRVDPNGARPEVAQLVANDLGLPLVGADPNDAATRTRPRRRGRFSWSAHLRLALLCLVHGHSFFEQGRARLQARAPARARTIARSRPPATAAWSASGSTGSARAHADGAAPPAPKTQ